LREILAISRLARCRFLALCGFDLTVCRPCQVAI